MGAHGFEPWTSALSGLRSNQTELCTRTPSHATQFLRCYKRGDTQYFLPTPKKSSRPATQTRFLATHHPTCAHFPQTHRQLHQRRRTRTMVRKPSGKSTPLPPLSTLERKMALPVNITFSRLFEILSLAEFINLLLADQLHTFHYLKTSLSTSSFIVFSSTVGARNPPSPNSFQA